MSKILKVLLTVIAILLGLITLIILLLAIRPDLSGKIADILYPKDQGASNIVTSDSNEIDSLGTTDDSQTETDSDIVSPASGEEKYVVPEETVTVAPQEVAGKNGFVPVTETTTQVDDAEGEQLVDTLGYGETGEGLEFDPLYYPYFEMLSKPLQNLYRQIYANALVLNENFTPIEEVGVNQIKNAFTAVFCDHPELFWLDTAYECKYLQSGKCIEISLQFNSTASNLDESKLNFNNKANQIIAQAQTLASNYEKEVYVHDTLISMIEYQLSAPLNQSAYSALVNGQTVCAGYARAYQYLMQQLGIPCYYCMGYAGESHAWNIVLLDDGYYNVDATWDDTNPNTYHYFNKTDSDFSGNHTRTDLSVYLPACNGQTYRNLEADVVQNQVSDVIVNDTTDELSRRSLADIGYAPENVLTNAQDYNDNCYYQIMQTGIGNYQFQNVVSSEELYNQILDDYENDGSAIAFIDKSLVDLNGNELWVYMHGERLQDGYILIFHDVESN